jgi:hypothetical protein
MRNNRRAGGGSDQVPTVRGPLRRASIRATLLCRCASLVPHRRVCCVRKQSAPSQPRADSPPMARADSRPAAVAGVQRCLTLTCTAFMCCAGGMNRNARSTGSGQSLETPHTAPCLTCRQHARRRKSRA